MSTLHIYFNFDMPRTIYILFFLIYFAEEFTCTVFICTYCSLHLYMICCTIYQKQYLCAIYVHLTLFGNYDVQYTLHSMIFTMYSVPRTVSKVQETVYSVQNTLYNVQNTLYSVQNTLYSVQNTLYSV